MKKRENYKDSRNRFKRKILNCSNSIPILTNKGLRFYKSVIIANP